MRLRGHAPTLLRAPRLRLRPLYTQLGKKPEELPPQQREQVKQGARNIFEAVDLTVKASRESSPSSTTCKCKGG